MKPEDETRGSTSLWVPLPNAGRHQKLILERSVQVRFRFIGLVYFYDNAFTGQKTQHLALWLIAIRRSGFGVRTEEASSPFQKFNVCAQLKSMKKAMNIFICQTH